ncbi:MAG: HD domain-containing protein [Planctomycetes bacterium]|nr:HD domain-containing protein [Planctomycetota bacterium]
MNAKIEVLIGRHRGDVYKLMRGCDLEFGRDTNCQIQVFDDGISRRHFAIRSIGNSFLIEDLQSSNGTFVNGKRIRSKILRTGDEIHIGAAKLRFYYINATHGYANPDAPQIELIEQPMGLEGLANVNASQTVLMSLGDSDSASLHDLAEAARGDGSKVGHALELMYKIGDFITSDNDLKTTLNNTMDTIMEVIPADRGYLLLVNEELEEKYEAAVVRTPNTQSKRAKLNISRTVLDQVIKSETSVLSRDTAHDPRLNASSSLLMQGVTSVLAVPILHCGKVLGAIYLDRQGDMGSRDYEEADLRVLTAIGRSAGIAIQNARHTEQLNELFYSCVKTLVATIEAKDPYTHGHSERVTAISLSIGEAMGLEGADLDNLRLGSLLHDIGKIGVPEKILRKPARLTDEEFTLMKAHPGQGGDILQNIKFLPSDAVDAVRYHHEKWNGTGYPLGLKGNDIPLFGRICAIADAFDAMTSNRPYRRNFDKNDVIAEFLRCAGSHFDRNITNIFVELLEEDEILPSFMMYESIAGTKQVSAGQQVGAG